jgi:hypothetical protein
VKWRIVTSLESIEPQYTCTRTALSGGYYTLAVVGFSSETGDYTVWATPDDGIV